MSSSASADGKTPEAGALAAMLEAHFGYPLPVVLRTGADIAAAIADDPFRGLDTTRLTRFVAMLADDAPPISALPAPAPDAGYALVATGGKDLFFTIDRDVARTPKSWRCSTAPSSASPRATGTPSRKSPR